MSDKEFWECLRESVLGEYEGEGLSQKEEDVILGRSAGLLLDN